MTGETTPEPSPPKEEPTPMIPQPMKVDDEPDVTPAWADPPPREPNVEKAA